MVQYIGDSKTKKRKDKEN